MFRAAVPETAIHEHGNVLLGKDEIRSDDGRACWPSAPLPLVYLDHLLSSPAGDAVLAEERQQGHLRLLIAPPANPRHHFRTLALGEYVRHPNPQVSDHGRFELSPLDTDK